MLDRYDFEHELATGARGAVYRGREISTGCAVSIKVFPDVSERDCGADPTAASKLPHSRLNHPAIAAIQDEGRHGELCYVVTAIAPGVDLTAHDRSPRLLPIDTVLRAIARVAEALEHAHRLGIVHGDVKPANIVFDAGTGAVSLIDFPAGAHVLSGTPAYLSPERLCGAGPSPASDQFALGVTLYQLICGKLPVSGRSRAEIAHRVVHEPHTDVRIHAPTVPPELARIIDKALAKEPASRYRSLGGMRRALANLLRAPAR